MPDVLIRDVPSDELDQLRAAAAERGTSLQAYLRDAVRDQVVHLRRQTALAQISERLTTSGQVSDAERTAVLSAVEHSNRERAEQLGDRVDR